MCGITGFVDQLYRGQSDAAINAMTRSLQHRGPDDCGHWEDREVGIRLGHRRLSILDLSSAGHQPMQSASGRYVITFNGEIYNFKELQGELIQLGYNFIGNSDTEIMLAAFEEWGFLYSLSRFNGMFAFAVWDKKNRSLHLARDRMGEKPLYYGWSNGMFFFGSELKSLKANPYFKSEVDRDSVALALQYGYIPAPWSIYKNIFKLVPGTLLILDNTDFRDIPCGFSPFAENNQSAKSPSYYWKAPGITSTGSPEPFKGSEQEASDKLNSMLLEAVSLRMISDVSIGAFLSGGIDSSTVVALMQSQSSIPVKTFAIGFEESDFNEAGFAKNVASYLQTEHTELYLTAKDILDVIPMLPHIFDEPFSDSSQIPTYLVSKLCAQQVTVCLSGDGGDELFGGYDRYKWASRVWSGINRLPEVCRNGIAESVSILNPQTYDRAYEIFRRIVPESFSIVNPGQKMHTFARIMKSPDQYELYCGLMSHWREEDSVVPNSRKRLTAFDICCDRRQQDFGFHMMTTDMRTYLPDDIMTKVDRTSMAVSLEARAPFLDHKLIEFATRLPIEYKLDGNQSKKILRNVLYRYVPENILERPKMGFSIPVGKWLRCELQDWAEDLLSVNKLEAHGFLNSSPIRAKWKEHLSGRSNWENHLWDVLMLQAWLERERS